MVDPIDCKAKLEELSKLDSDVVFRKAGFSKSDMEKIAKASDGTLNACALRLSIALYYAGMPLTSGEFMPNGKYYNFSVKGMKAHLNKVFEKGYSFVSNEESIKSVVGNGKDFWHVSSKRRGRY
jgi:hypothetical protein